jgi:hypothetical protein
MDEDPRKDAKFGIPDKDSRKAKASQTEAMGHHEKPKPKNKPMAAAGGGANPPKGPHDGPKKVWNPNDKPSPRNEESQASGLYKSKQAPIHPHSQFEWHDRRGWQH